MNKTKRTRRAPIIGIVVLFMILQGCSGKVPMQFIEGDSRPQSAFQLFTTLDKVVEREQVQHTAYSKINGFPYLRSNRYLTSLKSQLVTPEKKEAWVGALQALDLEARRAEIHNLNSDIVGRLNLAAGLDEEADIQLLFSEIKTASDALLNSDLQKTGFIETLQDLVWVESEYATTYRVFGLYFVAAGPVAYFSDRFFDQVKEWHKTDLAALEVRGELISFQPMDKKGESPGQIRRLFAKENRDVFGIPKLSANDEKKLATAFAPIFTQDVEADYDKIGRVIWKQKQVAIDIKRPTIYFYITKAFFRESPILQINYVLWYPGRLGDNTPWYERGNIDGITFRVSLDTDGKPFMLDMMNNCGCSHIFIPDEKRVTGLKEIPMAFDALVPRWLDPAFPQQPIRIRVVSGWHQMPNVSTERGEENNVENYELRPYSELEFLPDGVNHHKSIFNDEGIVYGSERVEPYMLFSMGVPEIGAMRQRGHHAIALVGRAHFDDPHLFNFYFDLTENSELGNK